ncbi:uncharacterized protein LOC108911915 [Anoplophora glabripennis]|uniref:uncharacterized protein LOC108911915 n=1 Tax=Anoplophora glabripennis TaxID=217634 RepID=UPI000C78FEA6|nr:uncharacterized protein LOC108911915 [Anoplophora glabripennis]
MAKNSIREHLGELSQNNKETQCTFPYEEISSEPLVGSSAPRSHRRSKGRVQTLEQQVLENEILLSVKDYFRKPRLEEDRFDIIGKTIAVKLRRLPKEQMLIAEKIVSDTLFQAEMGHLTMTHKLVNKAKPQRLFGRSRIAVPILLHNSRWRLEQDQHSFQPATSHRLTPAP